MSAVGVAEVFGAVGGAIGEFIAVLQDNNFSPESRAEAFGAAMLNLVFGGIGGKGAAFLGEQLLGQDARSASELLGTIAGNIVSEAARQKPDEDSGKSLQINDTVGARGSNVSLSSSLGESTTDIGQFFESVGQDMGSLFSDIGSGFGDLFSGLSDFSLFSDFSSGFGDFGLGDFSSGDFSASFYDGSYGDYGYYGYDGTYYADYGDYDYYPYGADYPVVLDLNGDGVKINPLTSSNTFFDMAGDGYQHRTAWAGAGDAVLAFDANNDGVINQKNEIVFTEWDPTAASDIQALLNVFDTNHKRQARFGRPEILAVQARRH
ncbi:MAG: hypothetical protein ACR65T_00235 [Methylocystis sp.]|uniref:hypothetical protein n=1 Tax=Methylocystis sp. TaxID=1911079 RepID=UPI003DA55C6A